MSILRIQPSECTCLSRTSWSSLFEVSRVLANSSTPEVSLSSLWTVWSSEMPRSFPSMKMTVLWRKRPQGCTGMEAGLSTTSTSPSSTRISRGVPTTGGSWRCTVFFMWSLFCGESGKIQTFDTMLNSKLSPPVKGDTTSDHSATGDMFLIHWLFNFWLYFCHVTKYSVLTIQKETHLQQG